MRKHLFFILIICCIAATFLSCKKYLDEKSNAALVIPSRLVDFQNLMDDDNTMNMATASLGASSADDYFIQQSSFESKTPYEQSVYTWIPHPYFFTNDWAAIYKALYVPNLCLERLPLVQRTAANAAEWDNVKGSALFFKAYNYLELAWLFAKSYDETTAAQDAGIVLKDGTDLYDHSVRSSVKESYTEILDNAREAAALLPPMSLAPTRPSKAAAFGLLARTFLSMRKYDSAHKYAHLSFQLTNGLIDYNDGTAVNINGSAPFKLFNKEVLFHSSMNFEVPLYSPTSGPARLDTVLFNIYHVNDIRRRAFFTATGGYHRFKGTYTGTSSRIFSGIATDEILLMRAECAARLNDKAAALADINLLLHHRFVTGSFTPVDAATAAEALEIILLERRKELIFRGTLRWMDVKRLNKENRMITMQRLVGTEVFSLPPNDKRFALQIPQDIIELTGIEQN